MMYLNTREARKEGELSAYSVFNENVEASVLLSFLLLPFVFFCPMSGISKIDRATRMKDLDREMRQQMY